MNEVNWLNTLTGFCIFLLSLRLINHVLERSLAKQLRQIFNSFLSGKLQCLWAGIISTVFFQASTVVIIATEGLLNHSLLSLEQGFCIMLGSTLGTTIKLWFFTKNIRNYALIIIIISTFALFVTKRPFLRSLWESVLAIGLAFFGFNMTMLELIPILQDSDFISWMGFYDSTNLGSQIFGILTGIVITFFLQSSSTFIFLVLALAGQNLITYQGAVCFILGANIGTSLITLLASFEYGIIARKLALSHFFIKTIGCFIVLFFLPIFLFLVDLIIPIYEIEYRVICFHTLFNFFNVSIWMIFSTSILRFINWSSIGDIDKQITLPVSVRHILVSNLNLTLQEIETQILKVQSSAKQLTDYCFDMLLHSKTNLFKKIYFSNKLSKNFESIRECIFELLIKSSLRHSLSEEQNKYIQKQLQFLTKYSNFYYQALSLCVHLEHGLSVNEYSFPETLQVQFGELQKFFNEIWFCVLQKQSSDVYASKIANSLAALESSYFTKLEPYNTLSYDYLIWSYEVINSLREIFIHIQQFVDTENRPNLPT